MKTDQAYLLHFEIAQKNWAQVCKEFKTNPLCKRKGWKIIFKK